MTITDASPAELSVPSDDLSWMSVSAASAPVRDRMANEMTTTIEDWLRGLGTRSVRRRRGRHLKERGAT